MESFIESVKGTERSWSVFADRPVMGMPMVCETMGKFAPDRLLMLRRRGKVDYDRDARRSTYGGVDRDKPVPFVRYRATNRW